MMPGPGEYGRVRYSPHQLARLLGAQEPTAEQAAVIGAPLTPMAVIAGAGSGKSETMAARLVWLVANDLVRPERVLGLTFTRKAAIELADRVRSRLDGLRRAGLPLAADAGVLAEAGSFGGAGPLGADGAGELAGDPVIGTYHAYAGRLVSDHALREGLEPTLRLITPAVCWQLAARVVAAYDGPADALEWTPATVTAAVLALAGEMSEHLRDGADVREAGRWLSDRAAELTGRGPRAVTEILRTQRTREQLLPMVAAYADAKAAREVMDYGDQLAIAATIASRHPAVGQAERARYQVVLLDEYQDTSHAQLVLLSALFGGGHPVTAVGDPCQSIYGWRGASAGNLRRFRTDFPLADGAPAEVRVLSTSFRNTGRVLSAAGAIQRDLRAAAPDVPLLVAPGQRADRGLVRCALLESAQDEAAWVADQIAGLLSGPDSQPPDWRAPDWRAPDGEPWPEAGGTAVRPRDIAVLCRKRAQFPVLRAALEARQIPVEVVGLGGLLTVPEVADIVATLNVVHDPAASPSLARLLTSPRWRIGPADLVALGRRARALAAEAVAAAARTQGAAGSGTAGPGSAGPGSAGPASREGAGDAAAAGRPSDRPGRAGRARRREPMPGQAELPGLIPAPREPSGAGVRANPVAAAVSDLTREPGSLVEALEDLGSPAAYSAEGHARLTALSAELAVLRGHVARPLAELVTEVERTLGLDIEVASRPGLDPAAARADLDAFADAAAAFAGDTREPTLGAFLAYLDAAETEEFGLEAGQVGESDSVKLATVHAAKGLQWSAVFVPGLADGPQRHVFPARPRVTTRWTDNARLLPFPLRGDAVDLPGLSGLTAGDLSAFSEACSARDLAEERRLAYVAATRAAYFLGCSGYWWSDGASRLGPSQFLADVRVACEDGAGEVDYWQPEPGADAVNPMLAEPPAAVWPAAVASGERYEAVREAAALVDAASRDLTHPASGSDVPPPRSGDADEYADLLAEWERDTDLLLAEREQRPRGREVEVSLPREIPVSALVTLARDPAELAREVRRPMPRRPAPQAVRGTTFHEWLEHRFGQAQLIDADDMPGAADDDDGQPGDTQLAALKSAFERGQWADRWPAEVEVPFETRIGDQLVRGRIDAIFADAAEGGYDVVDWKTGRRPSSAAEEAAVAIQLAAYRLAWAALAGVPLAQVRAAFYYVHDDVTVRPADLLDGDGLEAMISGLPVAGGGGRS